MKKIFFASLALLLVSLFKPSSVLSATTGAIFTTDSTCTGVNLNIYGSKNDVYLNGGPTHLGAAGLPDGGYYVQVTEPLGGKAVLGKSIDPVVSVSGGEFAQCYRLSLIVKTASSSFVDLGYDTTTNPGGEYKVWVSKDPTFPSSSSKTDNFKVKEAGPTPSVTPTPPPTARLRVEKFYDANADGEKNDGESLISGWKIRIQNSIDYIRYTPVNIILDPDNYTVTEFSPVEGNWIKTTDNPVFVALAARDDKTVKFGNVCLGAGGGRTLGFWSNKNGQALFGVDDLALMVNLNLRNANGSDFNPGNYTAFRTWLLGAKATNMAYMLSAQLSAMELNVLNGKVNG